MTAAYLDISPDLLRSLLLLPADCDIVGSERSPGNVRLLVEHRSIPVGVAHVGAVFSGDRVTGFAAIPDMVCEAVALGMA